MKQVAAILFFSVLLLNTLGFRFLNSFLQHQSDLELEQSLDNHQYSENELISFRLPLSVPYNTGFTEFERINGEVKVNGIIYKYVKRRIFKDTLEVLCIVNSKKMNLETAEQQYYNLCNEVQHPETGKKSLPASMGKNVTPEYCQLVSLSQISPHCVNALSYHQSAHLLTLSPYLSEKDEPPEQLKSKC